MVRPLQGEVAKKTTTITVNPHVWQAFRHVVEEKLVPKTSASAYLEAYMRQVINREEGGDPAAATVANDRIQLEERQGVLVRKELALKELIGKGGDGVEKRIPELIEKYKKVVPHGTTEDRIRRMLIDKEKPSGPIQEYFDEGGSETELLLLIRYNRADSELRKVNQLYVEVLKKQAGVTAEEIKAAKEAQAVSQKQTQLKTPEEDDEENEDSELEDEGEGEGEEEETEQSGQDETFQKLEEEDI
jgi:hypothetical protein